ncbi:FCD domain-containing protein [Aquibacillus halophilus]|uniref:FCD domain-containing protein n=1 Tax=Aquibacillus halophilus TaxID=930132 RepID=A0A6A8D9M4_9BACI|nr:GntR family transcriptional regulator [Aquibacillus halophilus]MRH41246.1 FCD domain-containing protein [Aquibacillus halophilus]
METLTLKEKAYQELKGLILTGELKAGEFLTERLLVEKLEMSRTPIRSALEKLEVEGFVRQSPKQGIMVESMSIEKAINIYDLRSALESYVVKQLAEREIDKDEKARIKQILEQQKLYMEQDDFYNFSIKDFEFHRALAEIYDNKEIIHILDQIGDKLRFIAITVMKKKKTRINIAYEEHLLIVDHIFAGNGEKAASELTEHFVKGKLILIS